MSTPSFGPGPDGRWHFPPGTPLAAAHHAALAWRAAQPPETRPPRVVPGVEPVPVWPAPDGRLRVGWLTPTLGLGGAERWIDLMAAHLDAAKVQPVGVVQVQTGPDSLRAAIERTCPVGKGWDAAHDLARTVDVLIAWGIARTPQQIGARRCRLVLVSHGNVAGWSRATTVGWEDADALVAVSEAAAGGFPDAARARVAILPNGVDPEWLRPKRSPAAVRAELGLAPAARIVLMVGRLSAEKRPEVLPATIALLPPEWHGVHVGPDSGYGVHVWQVHDALCPGRCVYTGPRDDVGDWLHAADCYLQTSESEGHSLALVEAFLAGVPVVTTPVGTVPEHPELVRLVPPLADGAACAAAVLANAADPKGTRDRTWRAKGHAWAHWTATAFGGAWTDYLLALPPREPEPAPAPKHVSAPAPARAPQDVQDARLAVCRGCDRYRPVAGRCAACGCAGTVPERAASVYGACPLGRWPG